MTTVRAALLEFSDDLERAADDFACAVSDLFPERYVELSPFEDEDDEEEVGADGRRVIRGSIDDRPDGEIDAALEDFIWIMKRHLRRLKEALSA